MAGLLPGEARYVRKLASILRVADALDRSHAQPVGNCHARMADGRVGLHVEMRGPMDLELWDVAHETQLFRKVFGVRLAITTTAVRHKAKRR